MGTQTENHQVGGQVLRTRRVAGDVREGPPAENGPTWTAKFTPRSDGHLATYWEVDWEVPPGFTYSHILHFIYEDGLEEWYRSGTGFASRTRTWHTYTGFSTLREGPGGGEPGGGG